VKKDIADSGIKLLKPSTALSQKRGNRERIYFTGFTEMA
jgi:hypothetical protein